nr:NfsB2 [uncultured bacterium]
MSTASCEQVVKQLKWRYATKQFDPALKITPQDWDALEEVLVLTPSSYGAQPWKFIVVTDQATKDKLVPFSFGQRQIADCSHLVVFAIRKDMDHSHVDTHIKRIAEVRGGSHEALAPLRKMIVGDVIEGPRGKAVNEWATRQVFIALGNFMTSAALLGIDTCPMEGFQPDKYDDALGLTAFGLASVVACCAGYRDPRDKYAAMPKVRFPKDDVIVRI